QTDDPCGGLNVSDLPDPVERVTRRQIEIDQHEIRPPAGEEGLKIINRVGRGGQLEVFTGAQKNADALSQNSVVEYKNNAYSLKHIVYNQGKGAATKIHSPNSVESIQL